MNFKNLKKIKGFSILIIPSGGGIETKSFHFTSSRAITFLGLYSLILLFAGFFILNITPLGSVFFPGSNKLSPSEQKIVNELTQKLIYLEKQLEALKSTNQQLSNAVMLGDSTLLDSISTKYNKSVNRKNKPYGDDIFYVIKKLFAGTAADTLKSDNSSIQFSMPLTGFISRGFNPENGHMGIDIVAKTGTPVYAAASGYVIFADYTIRDGYMMIIGHPHNYITVYKHCSALLKKARDIVTGGEIIALSGNTGEITTGPHLHFEIWKNGKPINPQTLLVNY